MKKILSLILALTLILSLSVTAFAAGEESGKTNLSGKIGVGDNKDQAYYEVEIPATLDLKDMSDTTNGYTSTKVGLKVARLLPNTAVQFTFKDSATTVTMGSTAATTKVVCDLIFTGSSAASFQTDSTTTDGSIKVTPHADDVANAKVGDYTGAVDFVIKVVDVTNG